MYDTADLRPQILLQSVNLQIVLRTFGGCARGLTGVPVDPMKPVSTFESGSSAGCHTTEERLIVANHRTSLTPALKCEQ